MWRAPVGRFGCPQDTAFLPQSPYFPHGTLEEAITYPRRPEPPMAPGELRSRLAAVRLEHLLGRDPAAQRVDWNSRLSLGERQQLGLGRMMLARPAFAVLDEGDERDRSKRGARGATDRGFRGLT